MTERHRFPVGLTIAALVALAVLIGLGVWQVQRLAWKTDMLARIAALQNAPAQPLAAVLDRAQAEKDVEYTRVQVDCPGLATAKFGQVYAVIDGEIASRLVSACPLNSDRFDAVLVDRGYILDTTSARPAVGLDTATVSIVGVLRTGDKKPPRQAGLLTVEVTDVGAGKTTVAPPSPPTWMGRHLQTIAAYLGVRRPAPYFLMAETSSNPEFRALAPKGVPTDIPNNHLSYALTWFGLAGTLVGVYAALLWRKMTGR